MQRFTSQLVEHCPAGQGYMVTVKPKLPIGTGSCKSPIYNYFEERRFTSRLKSIRLETKGGKSIY